MIPPPVCQGGPTVTAAAYVYLLSSLADGRFYVGWTTDVRRRLEEHNAGQGDYTRSRGPWELIGYEMCVSSEEAKKRERALKHNPRMLFLFKKRLLQNRIAFSDPRQVVG